MRILLASDMHLEHSKKPIPQIPSTDSFDVIVLAGDNGSAFQIVEWAQKFLPATKPVLVVPGNHEYYLCDYDKLNAAYQKFNEDSCSNIKILCPGALSLEGFRFIGATLWSNLHLKGQLPTPYALVEHYLADFRYIGREDRLFSAEDCVALNIEERAFLRSEIEEARKVGEVPIVVTHFVPTQLAIADKFKGDSLNGYFICDCDDLMEEFKLPLWMFGHSHVRVDFTHPAGTRIVSNAFGYDLELEAPEWKIIEL